MNARKCPGCGEMSRDGHLCHKCLRETKRTLRRISELWPTLQETITRQDHTAPPAEGHTQTIHGPVPFNAAASETARKARDELNRWVDTAVSIFGAKRPRCTVPAMCTTLLACAGQMRKQPGAVAWRRDILAVQASIVRAVDLTDRRAPAGPCPETTADGEPCPGLIVAIYPIDEGVGPHMDCTPPKRGIEVCGKTWPSQQWATLGARIRARQAQIDQQTARTRHQIPAGIYQGPPANSVTWQEIGEASVTFGVPLSSLHAWIDEGKLDTAEQTDEEGQIVALLVNAGQVEWLEWCGRASRLDGRIGA